MDGLVDGEAQEDDEPTHGKQAVGGEVIEALRHAAGAARSTGRVDLIRRK